VAKHVVDDLEAVEVHVQQPDAVARRMREAKVQLAQDRVAVHQAGQGVGLRLLAQRLLRLLALGDVLQGAGQQVGAGAAGFRFADHAHPERGAVGMLAMQLQFEAGALGDAGNRPRQLFAIRRMQAAQHILERARCAQGTKDALRLRGQVQGVAAAVPLPAADPRELLHAFEQGVVALELGDVAAQAQHHVRALRAGRELRHRSHRQPGQALGAAPVKPDHLAADRGAEPDRPRRGMLLARQRAPVFVDHQPVIPVRLALQVFIVAQAEHAHAGGVDVVQPAVAVLQGDRLVDAFHQAVVARFRLVAGAEVARHRDHGLAPVVFQRGRMHLHREAGAIGAHVGDFDDVGLAAAQRLQHRRQVVARQVGVEHFDRLADDVLARALVGIDAGLVEVEHGAVVGDDADRVRHGVEQGAVAAVFELQGGAGLDQHGRDVLHQLRAFAGQPALAADLDQLRQQVDQRRVELHGGAHAGCGLHAASALPALLPVSRPSRAASQRPVAASASRSMPVRMPRPCSM